MVDHGHDLSAEYANEKFDEKVSKDDPDYELKKTLFNEMRELRDKYYAQGHRRFALRKKVMAEMRGKHKGRAWEIIKFLLTVFSIILFFI